MSAARRSSPLLRGLVLHGDGTDLDLLESERIGSLPRPRRGDQQRREEPAGVAPGQAAGGPADPDPGEPAGATSGCSSGWGWTWCSPPAAPRCGPCWPASGTRRPTSWPSSSTGRSRSWRSRSPRASPRGPYSALTSDGAGHRGGGDEGLSGARSPRQTPCRAATGSWSSARGESEAEVRDSSPTGSSRPPDSPPCASPWSWTSWGTSCGGSPSPSSRPWRSRSSTVSTARWLRGGGGLRGGRRRPSGRPAPRPRLPAVPVLARSEALAVVSFSWLAVAVLGASPSSSPVSPGGRLLRVDVRFHDHRRYGPHDFAAHHRASSLAGA